MLNGLLAVLAFTIILAIVEVRPPTYEIFQADVWTFKIGLASDLDWELSRRFIGFRGFVRPRTRYLIFCSAWGILAGIFALVLAMAEGALIWALQATLYERKFLTHVSDLS